MQVSLIITTYNQPRTLIEVLRSVEVQSRLPDEIIIADDGSRNNTKKVIEDFKKKSNLKIIHSWQEDQGFRVAKSRNKAIAKSCFDYIILIDGDGILHKKFIEDHLNHAEEGFFIQGSRVFLNKAASKRFIESNNVKLSFLSKGLSNRENSFHSNFLSILFFKKNKSINGIKTCNLSLYKSDIINVNGFNNDFEGWGREDTDFVVRLFNNGVRRKNIHFNMIQFHLWHKISPRDSLKQNDLILKNTIDKRLIKCESGISKYL
jgi:glycosyltransferase involved in cell wall biosynthesis